MRRKHRYVKTVRPDPPIFQPVRTEKGHTANGNPVQHTKKSAAADGAAGRKTES